MGYRVYFEHNGQYYREYDSIREYCLEKAGYQCEDCGDERDLHMHHIIPKSEGGSNHHRNLKILCSVCHGKQHGKTPCAYCSNLVPTNDRSDKPYWVEKWSGLAVCYECKDDPYMSVHYNVPASVRYK